MRDSVTSFALTLPDHRVQHDVVVACSARSVRQRDGTKLLGRTVDLNGDAVIELWWWWRVDGLPVLVLRPAGVQIRAGEPAVVDQNLRALRDLDPRAWEALLEERRSEVFCAKLCVCVWVGGGGQGGLTSTKTAGPMLTPTQ